MDVTQTIIDAIQSIMNGTVLMFVLKLTSVKKSNVLIY